MAGQFDHKTAERLAGQLRDAGANAYAYRRYDGVYGIVAKSGEITRYIYKFSEVTAFVVEVL